MRHVPTEGLREPGLVIGVDLRVVPPARHRHIREPAVDELFAQASGLHVHEDAIGGLALAAVARDGVAVVEMRIRLERERHAPAGLETHTQLAARLNPFDGAQLPIRDVRLPERRRELHPVMSENAIDTWEGSVSESAAGPETPA